MSERRRRRGAEGREVAQDERLRRRVLAEGPPSQASASVETAVAGTPTGIRGHQDERQVHTHGVAERAIVHLRVRVRAAGSAP